ncbi:MAG: 1-deoxy-D-xylulose-5-phosphate synthase, partial [Candidatus Sedimenticola endophacoides]
GSLTIGRAEVRRRGRDIALLVFGSLLTPAIEAGRELGATVVNMRFVKPLDEAMIREMAGSHELLVTVEENVVRGGAGSAVNEYLAASGIGRRVLNLGLPDRFIEHATPAEQLREAGLDAGGIVTAVSALAGGAKAPE